MATALNESEFQKRFVEHVDREAREFKVEFDQMLVIAIVYEWNRQIYQEK